MSGDDLTRDQLGRVAYHAWATYSARMANMPQELIANYFAVEDREVWRQVGDAVQAEAEAAALGAGAHRPGARVYIAGPMTGYDDYNFPAFEQASIRLRERGYDVVSPHELHGGDTSGQWHDYLRADLAALLTCELIYLLDGWEKSVGAVLEYRVASALCMPLVGETVKAVEL